MNETFSKTSLLMSGVVMCLLACQMVRADFIFGEPEMVPNINSDASDSGPQISRNGLELYFSSTRDTGVNKLWVSRRLTPNDVWSEPIPVDAPLDPACEQVFPALSGDGLELYYADGTAGPANPGGYGSSDIWVLTRASINYPWNAPRNLGPVINTSNEESSPCISADGLELYFASNIPGRTQNTDIVMARRASKNDPWEAPVILNSKVNGSFYEYNPFISTDGLSLFLSAGFSTQQVYVVRRLTTVDAWAWWEFFTPVNGFGTTHNVSYSDQDSTIYFTQGSNVFATDFNIWQVKVTTVMDLNGDGAINRLDLIELQDHLGSTDSFYDMAPFALGDGVADDKDLLVLKTYLSKNSYPIDEATDIPLDVVLSWEPIELAQTYDVYFGADYNDVRDATTVDPSYMENQAATSYDPGQLDFGKTYYWRIDAVDDVLGLSVFKGSILSFTVESFSTQIPGSEVSVTASSATPANQPDMTINGSGLKGNTHSTNSQDMWLSAMPDLSPWLMYEFDQIQKLDQMLIWNANGMSEGFMGWGIKDVKIEYSIDGVDWASLAEASQISRGPGLPTYNEPQVIDFGLVPAKYVKINILNNWGGFLKQYGVAEVRFYGLPVYAHTPVPASGSKDVRPHSVIAWHAGREASQHTIYVSTDPNAVIDGLAPTVTSNTSSLDLASLDLDLGETYYWRVNEVNEAETPSVWPGPVWSFSTSLVLTEDGI